MTKRRGVIKAVMLLISIGNYARLKGNDNIRAIQFLSIFAIGALAAVLIQEVVRSLTNKQV